MFDGENQTGERDIYFKTSGTYPHNCSLYGGSPNSTTGIGLYDNKNGRGILAYLDASNTLKLGNDGTKFIMGKGEVQFTYGLRTYDINDLPNKPSGSSGYGRALMIGQPSGDKYYLLIDNSRHLYAGTQLNGATTITWTEK